MGRLYGELQNRARKQLVPFDTMYEVTARCNLRCVHCYNPEDRSAPELDTAAARGVLDKLAAAGGFMLTFTGGEALTRPDFFAIAGHAHALGFAMCLISNGTLLDAGAAQRLADLGFADVSVTLYGADAAAHEAVTRTPGSHALSVQALRLLRDAGVHTTLRSVIMKPNRGAHQALLALAADLGVRTLIDVHVSPRQDGNPTPLSQQLPEDELKPLYEDVRLNLSFEGLPRDGAPRPDCDAGRSVCSIRPDGTVYPCIQMPIPLGNLAHQAFEDIWHGTAACTVRTTTYEQLEECGACHLNGFCLRCSGVAYLEGHGLLGRSDSACAGARVIAGILRHGQNPAD